MMKLPRSNESKFNNDNYYFIIEFLVYHAAIGLSYLY